MFSSFNFEVCGYGYGFGFEFGKIFQGIALGALYFLWIVHLILGALQFFFVVVHSKRMV